MDPLTQLNKHEINIGGHQMTFVDTSDAWQSFRQIYPAEEILDNEENEDQREDDKGKKTKKRSTALKNFQDLLELDDSAKEIPPSNSGFTNLPEYAWYDSVYYDENDSVCDHCHQTTKNAPDRHSCRICERTFHEGCLLSRGFCSDELSRVTLAESENIIGWSCPNCEGLFTLLSDEEQEEIIELFTNVSGRLDKVL